MAKTPTFRLYIASLKHVLFDDEATSVYLDGEDGEYELLPYHRPILGALAEGDIVISGKESIAIRVGVVMFEKNKCTIIVEEPEEAEPSTVQKTQKTTG